MYDIALELIAHVDARVDGENVSHFVAAYQSVTPLALGELWAVPIMLRLGLIENLRRVSVHIARRRRDRNLANLWAGRLLAAVEKESATVLHVLAEMAESEPPFSNQFVEEFCGRIAGTEPGAGDRPELGATPARRTRPDPRAIAAHRQPGPGGRSSFHRQQHRQSALPERDGLAEVRRDDEHRRADAAH